MRASITTLILISILFWGQSVTAQTEKTLAKSFHPQGRTTIILNVADKVEIREWDNPMVRVQMKINLSHSNDALLKSLVETGRYHLNTVVDAQTIRVIAPQLATPLQLTNDSKETVTFIVFTPRNVEVKTDAESVKKLLVVRN